MSTSIGVAVIGAGMAGRAHAHGYRAAESVFAPDLPPIRLVSIADTNADFARHTAARYGFERHDESWEAIAAADDIDAVSVVLANPLHREVTEALATTGKHILCEKPLAPNSAAARAMARAADDAGILGRVGFTFRRSPAINAIKQHIDSGLLGPVRHFSGQYWGDYGCDPDAAMTWRYRGGLGSGALSDLGSHLLDTGEFLCGQAESVAGGMLSTAVRDRPVALGPVVGHSRTSVGEQRETVENEDFAAATVRYAGGATGTVEVSRVAHGHPNTLRFEVLCERGAARFDQRRPAEFELVLASDPADAHGYRRVLVGPEHPYIAGGLPMDVPGVGVGVHDTFAYQARAFLDEIAAREGLPPCPSFDDGVNALRSIEAIVESARNDGARTALT